MVSFGHRRQCFDSTVRSLKKSIRSLHETSVSQSKQVQTKIFFAMNKANADTLDNLVQKYLSQFESFDNVSLKDLKKYVALALNLPDGKVSKEQAGKLKTLVLQHITPNQSDEKEPKKRNNTKENETCLYTKGKFSSEDSKLIMTTIKRYAAVNNLDAAVISNFFAEGESGKNAHAALFADLASMLPHRNPKVTKHLSVCAYDSHCNISEQSIYQHADRLLIRPKVVGSFTSKEKAQLRALVDHSPPYLACCCGV